jgi:ABC-type multidrug transport system ATPase subunit
MVRSTLSAESIHKSFGRRRVLASAGLWARPGTIMALMGINGSGKTTLLKIAAGWMRADHGTVIFKDQAFERPRLPTLADLGLFFLPDRNLLSLTATLRWHFAALKEQFPAANVDEATDALGVEQLLRRKPKTFSGGERRRAALAVALAREPDCLLADEPFLDAEPSDSGALAAAFRTLADRGCAVVIAGQEVHDLMRVADEVVWMRAGTTEHLGTPADAQQNRDFKREYLGQRTVT